MEIKVKTIDNEYSVYVGYNLLDKCEEYISFPNKTLHAGTKQNTEPIALKIVKTIVLNFLLKLAAINPLNNRIIIPIK